MLEFKILQKLKANSELLELLKNFEYKIKQGKVKVLVNTNLQFIELTEYLITSPTPLTILEYKVNEISSKNFFKNRGAKMHFSEQTYRGGDFFEMCNLCKSIYR